MTQLSIVIPSFNRAVILLETIEQLLQQTVLADELIVVDQTSYAAGDLNLHKLALLQSQGKIRFFRRAIPSIPAAMNFGLLLATSEYVLFVDDDIRISKDFIAAHRNALQTHRCAAQVGQVLQPGQMPVPLNKRYQAGFGLRRDLDFPFNANQSAQIYNCMAGNLCVRRELAITAGGFDENFAGAAYRFESEFCRRLIRASGNPFHYTPAASIDHLQYPMGGTRSEANHLTSLSPAHSMGDYYFALVEGHGMDRFRYIAARLTRCITARFYVRRPWFAPIRLIAELRGLIQAIAHFRRGPKLTNSEDYRHFSEQRVDN